MGGWDAGQIFGKLLCYSTGRHERSRLQIRTKDVVRTKRILCSQEKDIKMARKTPSRLEKRKEFEAAEALEKAGSDEKATKKKVTRKTTTTRRTKVKAPQRKRLVWGVFNGSMKEQARFPYEQREEAEAKLTQLRARSTKRMFFIQPIKEPVPDAPPAED